MGEEGGGGAKEKSKKYVCKDICKFWVGVYIQNEENRSYDSDI